MTNRFLLSALALPHAFAILLLFAAVAPVAALAQSAAQSGSQAAGQTTSAPPVQAEMVNAIVAPTVVVTPPPPKTQLQSTADKKGALIVAGYTDVGTVQRDDGGYVRITAAEYTDTSTSVKAFGLLVFVHAADGADRETRSYIDDDELDNLLASLDSMSKLDHSSTDLSDFDARFRTRGDLEIANVTINGSREVTFRGVEISATTGQEFWAATHFPLSRLAEVAQYMTTGKQLIDKAKADSAK